MADGYLQGDELVDVPCHIEHAVGFGDGEPLAVIVVGCTHPCLERFAGVDGEVHGLQASVAGNLYHTADGEAEFVDFMLPPDGEADADMTRVDLCGFHSVEEGVVHFP